MLRTQLRIAFSVLFISFCFNSAPAHAASGKDFGLGVVFGEPTGITAKFWQGSSAAFDAGVAYAWSDYFLFYGDYLQHFPALFGNSTPFVSQLKPYVGIGAVMIISDRGNRRGGWFGDDDASLGLGARIPLGVEWLAPTVPLGVFVELVPGVGVFPRVFGFFNGGIGIRYYF